MTRFAPRPDLAARVAQVWAAERLLDLQGWGAWPACTRKLGYTSRDAPGTPLSVRRALTSDGRWATRVQRTRDADVLAGRDVTSRFVVRRTVGGAVAKVPVRVCTKPRGGTLRCVKRVTDGRGQVVSKISNADSSARVWATALGTNRTAASRSSDRRVVVRPTLALSAASLSVLDSATQQTLPPSRAGVVVVDVGPDRRYGDYEVRLQQRQDGQWMRVRTLRTSGPADSVSEAVDPGTYRVVVPGQHNMARRVGTAVAVTG